MVAGGNMDEFVSALIKFNLILLQAFHKKGIKTYKTVIYAPFGKDIPIEGIIKAVKAIKYNSRIISHG